MLASIASPSTSSMGQKTSAASIEELYRAAAKNHELESAYYGQRPGVQISSCDAITGIYQET